MIFDKKYYNFIKPDAVYAIKSIKIIKVLDFKLPIIKNLFYDINSEENKVIKPIKNIQKKNSLTPVSLKRWKNK